MSRSRRGASIPCEAGDETIWFYSYKGPGELEAKRFGDASDAHRLLRAAAAAFGASLPEATRARTRPASTRPAELPTAVP